MAAGAGPELRAPALDREAVHGYVAKVCFKTGPPELVGAELEWLVVDRDDPAATVPIAAVRAAAQAAGPPPCGSRVTYEPGGQVELSSLAHRGASACWQAVATDAEHLRRAAEAAGLLLLPTALDPFREPHRQLRHPRYDAMERYFAVTGGDTARFGPVMMSGTAALQVNLDAGRDRADVLRRWRLLHAVGPALVAAFANSPVHAGRDTGWVSGRQQVWQRLDPARTRPVVGDDPVAAWADYALDAPVMLTRRSGADWSAPDRLTFGDWLRGGPSVPRPEEADLATHLTTLFPPVRPRGWFEVRYLDALPPAWWPVPVAVLSALADDPAACAAAMEACAGADDWEAAARDGLRAPGVHDAALACVDAALGAMVRASESAALVAVVADYRDRYVHPGRCPADDPMELP